jgi:16S rRNA G966 N2-methylase RsmD
MLAFEAPVEVVRGNALKVLEEWAARGRDFACVFADPPYRYPLQRELLERARRVLASDGLFVLEASRPFPLEAEAHRVYRYGDTVLALFHPA